MLAKRGVVAARAAGMVTNRSSLNCAVVVGVEPGVWMVCAEATPFGTPTKAPSVAFSAL